MSIPKLFDHTNYLRRSTESNPTTRGDMYRYVDNVGTVLEADVAVTLWQPSTTYAIGTIVKSPSIPIGYVARCTKAGTSSESEPEWKEGSITDNSVTWVVTIPVMAADKATSDEAKAGTGDKVITATTLKTALDAALATQKQAYETALANAIAAAQKQAKLDAHPVGSYYFSDKPDSPATLFGGTWEALPAGYTLIAQGSGTDSFGSFTYKAGEKYGERMHKLTVEEMAAHNHGYYDIPKTWAQVDYTSQEMANFKEDARRASKGVQYTTDSAGGDHPHNVLQPSICVYAWRRQA